ncbi:MAG: hypothetical protein KAR57_00640 [Bacteroidales bacterium]|nr:hypothetical protein [Bacteroidales bacterium]
MTKKNYIAEIYSDSSTIRIKPGSVISAFMNEDFYAVYECDFDLSELDDAVLIIPFVLATAAIIWCSGEEVYIDRLDSQLTQSLPKIKAAYAEMYPSIEWNGNIRVLTSVSTSIEGKSDGLLFSGGIDSIHSVFNYPNSDFLFTIWGADTNPEEDISWKSILP